MVLAVDLGGTKTALATVDEAGVIHKLVKYPAEHTLEASLAQIAAAAETNDAAGIIIPGIYNPHTGMAWAPNLWGWDEVPLRDQLASCLSIPFVIDSDRSGYVLGEQWLGAAKGLRDVVFVAVGTGIGVGILADGRVVRGAHGIAGAAGWFTLDPNAGCWEAESAGPAVAKRAGMPDAESVVAAARAGNKHAREALHHAAKYIGMGVANIVSLLNPEMVVLGGGLMQASDLMLDRIRDDVRLLAQPMAVRHTRIELTALGENAGLLGAARLGYLK